MKTNGERMRQCAICEESFPETREFFYDSTKGMFSGGKRKWGSYCMQCMRMYQIIYYRKDRLKISKRYIWSGRFETTEQLNRYLNHEKIECLLCGKYYQGLNVHILCGHKMPVKEYKKLFGIPPTRGLVGTVLSAKRRAHGKTKTAEHMQKMAVKGLLTRRKNPELEKGRVYTEVSKPKIQKNAKKGGRTEDILKNKIEAICHKCQKPIFYSAHGFKVLEAIGKQPTCYVCRWKRKNKKVGLKRVKNINSI